MMAVAIINAFLFSTLDSYNPLVGNENESLSAYFGPVLLHDNRRLPRTRERDLPRRNIPPIASLA